MKLQVVVENASELAKKDNTAFAMMRRVGFGASDSSIILGVNPFPNGTIHKLIQQKKSDTMTDDERKIGEMVNVRKGTDLEPLILQKFTEKFNIPEADVEKPTAMYRIGDSPLTVNFDGVWTQSEKKHPIEVKFVSIYGQKYYNFGKSIEDWTSLYDLSQLGTEVNSIYLTRRAEECGIPIYYYTQIQQQLFALNATHGYLAVLVDKDWELRVFPVMADRQVWNKLLGVAEELWNQIQSELQLL